MSLLGDDDAQRLTAALVSRAGGYLRNPVRQPYVTCSVCTEPVKNGWSTCYVCGNRTAGGLADATAFITYAIGNSQSAYVMRAYKAQPPVEEHVWTVAVMVWLALSIHQYCPAKLAGMAVTHWATVPSLPAKPGEHCLHYLIRNIGLGAEARLLPATAVQRPRDLNPAHFVVDSGLPGGSHVLLIDDTWASGGHAQSAAIALHRAGAAKVSLLVVARWLNEGYGDNASFIRGLHLDFNPAICPWTGAACPW